MENEESFSVNITVREDKLEDRKVFVVNNEDTGIADFGDTLDEAIQNFKTSLREYLKVYPEKRNLLIEEQKEPILVSRVLI